MTAVGRKKIIFVVEYLQYLTVDRNFNLKTEDVKKSLNEKIVDINIIRKRQCNMRQKLIKNIGI